MKNEYSHHLDLDDVQPGMVLMHAVHDAGGGLLFPAGAVLDDAAMNSLQRRGIDSVRVLNAALGPTQLAAERARIEKRLGFLFRTAGDAAQPLHAHVLAYQTGETP